MKKCANSWGRLRWRRWRAKWSTRPTPGSSLFHETAFSAARRTQFVIEGIVQREDAAGFGGQASLHIGAEPALLILLLGLVPTCVIDVHGAPRRGRMVGGSAVPHVGVHHDHVACFSKDELLG